MVKSAKSKVRNLVTLFTILALAISSLLLTGNTLSLEFQRSILPSGGARIIQYSYSDSTVYSDSSFHYAAIDSGGIWLQYDSVDLQRRLHYFLIDSVFSVFDGLADSTDAVPEDEEYMQVAPDSSALDSGYLVYYGKSAFHYTDSITGQPLIDSISTRARLLFQTVDGQTLALEDSIPQFDYQPALRVTEDFKVNIAIEARIVENGNLSPSESWSPAIDLWAELTGSSLDSLEGRTFLGFKPKFYYDTTEPSVGDLSVMAKSLTSFEICWTPPSENADSLILEVKEGNTEDFVFLKAFANDSTNCYLHTGLDSTSVYSYRLRAVNGNGASGDVQSPIESTGSYSFTEVEGTTSGFTPVSAQVNESGGVSANIPITLPTGTSGMQPQLSLSVQHHSGEPHIGGLSMISRVAPTRAQDGFTRGIQFNQEDRFTLDGERLIAVQGDNGEAGARYRTEQETFQDVVSEGSRASGPSTFEVRTKDGLKKFYGDSDDSKIELGGDEDKIMYWLLHRVEDVFGNYYTISYLEDSENSYFYPEKITYTGNDETGLTPYCEVHFEYEDRPDVFKKFMLGDSIKRAQRLKSIKAYYQNELVRKYDLSYKEIGFNAISFLGSVTEYGSDGGNFSSTVFEWDGEDNTVSNEFSDPEEVLAAFDNGIRPYSTGGTRERFVDMNNDGRSDYVFIPDGRHDLYVALSNGTGFDEPVKWLSPGTYGNPYSTNSQHENFADFNGDNITDYAWVPSGKNNLWVALGDGGEQFLEPEEWLSAGSAGNRNPYSRSGQHEFFLDFNGDGRSDYLFFPDGGEDWYIATSVGTGFENNDSEVLIDKGDASTNSLISTNGQHETFMDINNDGYLDFVYRPSGTDEIWAIRATGDEQDQFKDAIKWLSKGDADGSDPFSAEGRYESYADVNGDGLADRIWKPSNKDQLFVALSDGLRLEQPVSWLNKSDIGLNVFSTNGRYQFFLDVNRDGLSDFLYYPHQSDGLYVAYSTGSSFAAPQKLLDNTVNGINSFSANFVHDKFGDVNGDGVLDKVWRPNGKNEIYVSFLSAPNTLLASATNGHGLQSSFEYKPLTDSTVYERGNDAVYPFVNFQAPVYVVSSQTTDDGIGGDYTIQYRYFDAQIELRGRGFRGYARTENIDAIADRRSVSYFNRDFRHVGTKVERTEEYAGGTKISEMVNDLALKVVYPGVYWSFAENVTRTSYELNGSLVKTESSYQQYDDFGNATYIEKDYGEGFSDVTENVFENNEDVWHLGRLTSSTVTRSTPTQTASRSSTFEYHTRYGVLTGEVLQPGDGLQFEKEYVYDDFGNVVQTTSKGSGEERTQVTMFDDKGRFVVENTNAAGHTETIVREPHYGLISTVTGPNDLTTYFKYDGFGRKTSEIQPNGITSRYVYRKSEGAGPDDAVYFIQTETGGLPPSITYYDVLDRVLRTEKARFDGQMVKVDMVYNQRGHIAQESDPYTGTRYWTTYEYDVINRPVRTTAPGGRISSVTYDGLTTQMVDPKGQTVTQVEDVLGRMSQVIDNLDGNLEFEYDAFGNLIKTADAAGNVITSEYNIRGFRTKLTDPDMGTFQYTYNAFGELLSQTYPEGNVVELQYDQLSRLTQRSELEGTTTWTYDTEFIGSLSEVSADGYKKKVEYDSYGRPNTEQLTLGEETYETFRDYDILGRIQRVVYPSGLTVLNKYNDAGFLSEVSNEEGLIYWLGLTYNDRGQSTEQKYGNDLDIVKTYNDNTGYLEEIEVPSIQGARQHLQMTYDVVGNITSRADLAADNSLLESFTYDGLNRLTASTVGDNSVTLKYDAIGNITFKSDVGSYTYGGQGAGPHAVTSISSSNCPSFQIEEIDYTSFQKVRELTKDSVKLTYRYAPDRMRYRSVVQVNDSVSQTKTYVGALYEHIQEGDTLKELHYIHTPEGVVAIETIINRQQFDSEIRYLHKDHLGSVQTVTDENGLVVEVRSFDAWGKPRDAATWEPLDMNPAALFDRGFTMHEFMSLFTLVNMNGRIYDPVIGRFISADPFINGDADLQGYNRYSYVRNNPLTLVDPSGYFFKRIFRSVRKVFKKVARAVKKTVKAVGDFIDKHKVTILSVGVGILTGGIGAALAGSGTILGVSAGVIGSGFGAGFGAATTASLLNGASLGDALKAGLGNGLIGAATAGFLAKINQVTPDWVDNFKNQAGQRIPLKQRVFNQLGRMGSRAIVNGAAAELRGGEFRNAAFQSFTSDAVRWGRDAYVENYVLKDPKLRPFRKSAASTTDTPSGGGGFKKDGQILLDPSKFSNVGTHVAPGTEPNWWIKLVGEPYGFMSGVGSIPGMNSMSVFHDLWATKDLPRILNEVTIPPAMAIEYYGLLGAKSASRPRNNKFYSGK